MSRILFDLAKAVRDLSIAAHSLWRRSDWERLGARFLEEPTVSRWREGLLLKGRAGALTVSVAGSPTQTQVAVGIPGPPDFSEVSVRNERRMPWKGHEIEIGSRAFDEAFFLGGPPRLVLALLDAEVRGLLFEASRQFPRRFEIFGGELVAEMPSRQIARRLPLLLEIAETLARPLDVRQRLLHNATQDPEAGVRLQNLLALTRENADDPQIRAVLRAACTDGSPEVRLRAGKALGAEGVPVLLRLTDDMPDDAICAEAVASLGRELSPERLRGILRRCLAPHFTQTARAAMVALSREGEAAVELLVEVLDNGNEPLAIFAAETLVRIGSPAAEGPLIQALQQDRPALRLAVAKALGALGTAEAVVALQQAAQWFSREPPFVLASQQAITEIQARLPGATPGQLSLAETEAGQLSLSTEPAGQLSLTALAATHENASPAGRNNS